ncbi:MAG: alpha-glucan family phosphorylase [Phycisphaerales bacterium]
MAARIAKLRISDPFGTLDLLRTLASDLWWSWNENGQRPFAALDPRLWEATRHSPTAMLRRIDPSVLEAKIADERYRSLVADADDARRRYYATLPWYEEHYAELRPEMRVAYFCSEFALHESMQQYAGGLGVLAGDHLKSASDLGIPLCGVGLLYRTGYYVQELRGDGTTRVLHPHYDYDNWPLEDTRVKVDCPIGSKTVRAKVWKVQVGRVPLYLLDTDIPENRRRDRALTQALYQGDPELRLRQQVLLGVGGVLALRALKEKPTVYHLNEGHAAFAGLRRLATLVQRGLTLQQAVEHVRRTTVFTTHTPVPAGHDRYDVDLSWKALRRMLRGAGFDSESFADFGREHPGHGPICMTVLALRMAGHVNGVSKLHGRVSREMWKDVYGVPEAEVPIGSVTNGVHVPTWLAPEARDFWSRSVDMDFSRHTPDADPWQAAKNVGHADFWAMRGALRRRLVDFIRQRLQRQAICRGESPSEVLCEGNAFRYDALTIGFARRFATYKRAPLIFHDVERIMRILGNPDRPVQIVFAGKAHPRDQGGQEYAQMIWRFAHDAGFAGRVALVEEYDMEVGRMLTSGCDVWLNNPLRPYEASGTSGMKPPLHGGLNLSVLDGWWPESYDTTNGWAIGDGTENPDHEVQNAADAESLYTLLEEQVIPEFYDRGSDGLPARWITRALRSVVSVPAVFNTDRMVGEYLRWGYLPAHHDGVARRPN